MPKVLNKRTIDIIPPDAVYVGRPSKWGSPYRIGASKWRMGITVGLGESDELTREEAIKRYRWMLLYTEMGATLLSQIDELRGKDLVCWCAPLPCHADILLELANQPSFQRKEEKMPVCKECGKPIDEYTVEYDESLCYTCQVAQEVKEEIMDIREKIADFIYTICEGRLLPRFGTLSDEKRRSYYNKADQILALIKEAGYVKLAEDQNLPFNQYLNYPAQSLRDAWDTAVRSMLAAGWRSVELEVKE